MLRYFSPSELLRLFAFNPPQLVGVTCDYGSVQWSTTGGGRVKTVGGESETMTRESVSELSHFEFPSESIVTRKKQYELIGNSLNVTVATHLLTKLLGGGGGGGLEQRSLQQQQHKSFHFGTYKTVAFLFFLIALLSLFVAEGKAPEDAVIVFEKGEGGYYCHKIPYIIQTLSGALVAFAEGRGLYGRQACDDFR